MDKKEFVQAYDKYADAIFRHCYFRVYDHELAKDLMQETFKKTWVYIINGNNIQNPKAFLYKTATNLIIDHKRKKWPVSLDELKEKGFEPEGQNDDYLYTQLEAKQIISLTKKLNEQSREVIILRYVDGFSPREIGEILDRSKNVVSVRLNRAVKKLKNLISESKN